MGDVLNKLASQVGGQLIALALPILATIIAAQLVKLLQRQLKRIKIELTTEQEDRLKVVAHDAIMAVEEAARRSAMSPAAKKDMAVNKVIAKLPHVAEEAAHEAVDAQLPVARAKLVPATPGTFGRRAGDDVVASRSGLPLPRP